MKKILIGIVAVFSLFAFGLAMNWFFAPKYEQVRHDTFKQSQAYNDGVVTELQNMRFDYVKTTDENAKKALASIILHRAAPYDEDKLPNDLRVFIHELKGVSK